MSRASDVKALATELRPYIETLIDTAEILKGMASAAREKGIDWTALKALVKAQALDARDGTDKRVAAIIDKADFAASYADMLGFASANMNNFSESRSSSFSIAAGTAAPAQKPVQQEYIVQAPSSVQPSATAQAMQASAAMARSGGDAYSGLEPPAFLDRRRPQ